MFPLRKNIPYSIAKLKFSCLRSQQLHKHNILALVTHLFSMFKSLLLCTLFRNSSTLFRLIVLLKSTVREAFKIYRPRVFGRSRVSVRSHWLRQHKVGDTQFSHSFQDQCYFYWFRIRLFKCSWIRFLKIKIINTFENLNHRYSLLQYYSCKAIWEQIF